MELLLRRSLSIFYQSNACIRRIYLPTTRFYSSNIIDGPDKGPVIPPYEKKQGESNEVKKARLLYQSRLVAMFTHFKY